MSNVNHTYISPKRIWVAQPRRIHGWKCQFKVRAVSDYDATTPENLRKPDEFLGNGHEPFYLYYHVDEVKRLIAEAVASVQKS